MSKESSKITIDKLKRTIIQLSADKRISVDLSLKMIDFINQNKLFPAAAERFLISLTTLALTNEELEKMFNYYLKDKKTVVTRKEDIEIKEEIDEKVSIKDIERAIEEEKKSEQFDYREYVYNYLFTIIATINNDNIAQHYVKIKSEVPQVTEREFKLIFERVIKDNEELNKPYEGRTEELENTLELFSAIESDELPAFSTEYVHLIRDPSAYMQESIKALRSSELLTKEDEMYYGELLRSSNPIKRAEARQKFTLCNLRLVMYVVRQFSRNEEDLVDLFDEGFIGLQKAIQKFDYKKGNKFSTYAIWWIKRAILKYLQTTSRIIRIPVHLVSPVTKLSKLERKIMNEENIDTVPRRMLAEKAKQELNIDYAKFNDLYPLIRNQVSFNELSTEEIDQIENTVGSSITNELLEIEEQKELEKTIEKLFRQLLTDKECEIMYRRYGIGKSSKKMTLQEIANEFSVSKERIRQIEKSAHIKLKTEYVQKTLSSYFNTLRSIK